MIPGYISLVFIPVRNTPDINIVLLGHLAFLCAQVMSYELTAELLNFGAFLGFMGVNAGRHMEILGALSGPTRSGTLCLTSCFQRSDSCFAR